MFSGRFNWLLGVLTRKLLLNLVLLFSQMFGHCAVKTMTNQLQAENSFCTTFELYVAGLLLDYPSWQES